MPPPRDKFDTQCNHETGLDIGKVDQKRKEAGRRPHMMDAYLASHEKFAPLYKRLAQ
jgi:hypothetical protein